MNFLFKSVLNLLKLKNLTPFLNSILNMGRKGEVSFPKELIPLNLEILLKGLLTSRVYEINSNWIYPFWLEEQLNPKSEYFIPRGANIFAINTTFRNWTILGSIESEEKGVIDLKGLISPRENFPSLDIFVEFNGSFFFPSKNRIEQKVDTLTGIVTTYYDDENFEYKLDTFSSEKDLGIYLKYLFLAKKDAKVKIYFLIRPFNPESFIPIFNLSIKENALFVNSNKFLIPLTEGFKFILCEDESEIFENKLVHDHSVSSKYGLLTGGVLYEISLNKGEERVFYLFLPQSERENKNLDYEVSIKEKREFFKKEREEELNIITPDERTNQIFDSNKVYLKSLINPLYITPGPLTYKKFWFRDSAYMVTSLMKIGDLKRSRKIIDYFKKKIKRDGYFQSQVGEWDSNGQAIFTIVEYYRYSRDKNFLKEFYPLIKKGAEWIERKRNKYFESRGLLPSSFSAEHFGPNDFYYYDDYFGLKGLFDAYYSAKELEIRDDENKFLSFYSDFKKDVRMAIDEDQKRLNKKISVGAYGRKVDASMIATFTSIFPLRLDLLTKEEVLNTYFELKERFFVNNCFYQNITHSGINLYLTLEIANAFLYLGEFKIANELFESVISLLTKTFTGPEAINPKSLGGCEGDGHHGWLVSELIHYIRNSLLFEGEDKIYILSGSKEEWFKNGRDIVFNNGPTHFGTTTFEVKIDKDIIDINFLNDFNENLKEIFVYIPIQVREIVKGEFKRRENSYFVFNKCKNIVFKGG